MRRTSRKRRMRANRRGRSLRRNLFGSSLVGDVLMPALGAVAGFAGARILGTALTESSLPVVGGDARMSRAAAGIAGALGTVWAAGQVDFVRKNQGALIIGMGVSALAPEIEGLVSPATSVVSPMATPVTSSAAPTTALAPANASAIETPAESEMTNAEVENDRGLFASSSFVGMHGKLDAWSHAAGAYYNEASLGSLIDISHAGAPYRGMLGMGDPADQSVVDDQMDMVESVSIVEPTDVAMLDVDSDPWPPIKEKLTGSPGDRGYAGGLYARTLFSGVMS